jgi:hypothetical protein
MFDCAVDSNGLFLWQSGFRIFLIGSLRAAQQRFGSGLRNHTHFCSDIPSCVPSRPSLSWTATGQGSGQSPGPMRTAMRLGFWRVRESQTRTRYESPLVRSLVVRLQHGTSDSGDPLPPAGSDCGACPGSSPCLVDYQPRPPRPPYAPTLLLSFVEVSPWRSSNFAVVATVGVLLFGPQRADHVHP